MGKARKILRRLRTVENIHAITRAMYIVSTARFKQAYDRLNHSRPYIRGVLDLAAQVSADRPEGVPLHPLQKVRPAGPPDVLVVLASRRGLCSSYNYNVVRAAQQRLAELRQGGGKALLRCSGKRGQFILETLGEEIAHSYVTADRAPDAASARALADGLMGEFLRGDIHGVEVAYTQFLSASRQKPAVRRLLPLEGLPAAPASRRDGPALRSLGEGGSPAALGAAPAGAPAARPADAAMPPYYIPSRPAVLEELVPHAVRTSLYQCFLEAFASEQVARMTAMRSASDNAEDLMHDLTVRHNRARQAQITTELAEIMGGRQGIEEL